MRGPPAVQVRRGRQFLLTAAESSRKPESQSQAQCSPESPGQWTAAFLRYEGPLECPFLFKTVSLCSPHRLKLPQRFSCFSLLSCGITDMCYHPGSSGPLSQCILHLFCWGEEGILFCLFFLFVCCSSQEVTGSEHVRLVFCKRSWKIGCGEREKDFLWKESESLPDTRKVVLTFTESLDNTQQP